jgi:hypothetical protein
MFGAFIVFAGAVSLVATYIYIVNRLLRSDENWNESSHPVALVSPERPATLVRQARTAALLTPNRV